MQFQEKDYFAATNKNGKRLQMHTGGDRKEVCVCVWNDELQDLTGTRPPHWRTLMVVRSIIVRLVSSLTGLD